MISALLHIHKIHDSDICFHDKVLAGDDCSPLFSFDHRGLHHVLVGLVYYWFWIDVPCLGVQYLNGIALFFTVEDEIKRFGVNTLQNLVLASDLGL